MSDLPTIDERELQFSYARSGGPGGQNVNKLETKALLAFDIGASPSLTDEQKARVRERLASRINREGLLRVTAQRHRTQEANKQAAIERFHELIRHALRPRRARKRTRIPKSERRRRVEAKRRRGNLKSDRRGDSW